jgi:hypothetical protein
MRKISLLLIVTLIAFASCKRSDIENLKPISISLNVNLDPSISAYNFPLKNAAIKFTNLTNGQITEGKTDASGSLTFPSLSPGNYDIQATLTISAADYSVATGATTLNDVVFNGLLKNQNIVQATNSLSIVLKTGRIGDWVFKQIYYAGSNTTNGATFRDQFIEIYNNSNEILYADSLCFAQVFGTATKTAAIDLSRGYYQAVSKQFDWTKSIGMSNSKANTDYVYAKTLFMVPGTGKQYPVQPGSSIIIAATAINHKSPYVGIDGKAVTVKDPSLTIDLSAANFEIYLGDQPGINPLPSDVDNPAVVNLSVLDRGGSRDLILDATGRDAYVIFKTNENITSWMRYPAPDQATITTTTDLYYQIPSKYIFDGVEIQPPLAANEIPKKLEPTIDAGFKFVSKGQYSSQSLIRKTAKTVNGRRILQDTNNSTNDFDELDIPDVTRTIFK